jgi:predicted transcriptional regulator
MNVADVARTLSLTVAAGEAGLDAIVEGGYVADLLSCAMAGARAGDVWITLQGHLNVVAVADLNDLAAVIVAEGKPVAPEALAKADEKGVPILTTPQTAFTVAGRLWELGLRA